MKKIVLLFILLMASAGFSLTENGGLYFFLTATLSPTPHSQGQPDLQIMEMWLVHNQDCSLAIELKVVNGGVASGAFDLAVTVNGKTTTQRRSGLHAGGISYPRISGTGGQAGQIATAVVDAANEVGESDENNNTFSGQLWLVTNRPDCATPTPSPIGAGDLWVRTVLLSLDPTKRCYTPGIGAGLLVKIYYEGDYTTGVVSPPFNVKLKINGQIYIKRMQGIRLGTELDVWFENVGAVTDTFTVIVDPRNEVAETNETNNVWRNEHPLPIPTPYVD
jgi:hypothetical protein